MRVLSLFDGISVARASLESAGIKVETYYASEIDKHAIEISKKNFPDIIQLGSVVGLTPPPDIDLLIGGSPCQDLSIAKKDRKGLEGARSGLFWEYIRIKEECKPTYFILENVASMPKKDRDTITTTLGVQPILFNASLVSAQSRKRLFWTNIPFELPEDRDILLKDILQPDAEVDERMVVDGKAFCLTASYQGAIEYNSVERKQRTMVKVGYIGNTDAQANRVYDPEGKSCTLSANGGGLGAKTGLYQQTNRIRKLTPIECERLQSLPDNYTEGVAKTHRYKCLGNAFNMEVVAHILKNISPLTNANLL
jgi:DNA (cytosine-5)-methyltransferase 3A